MHRWRVCPRQDALRGMEGRNLARLGAKTDWQPKCLWECGLLPSPGRAPAIAPPRPPPKRSAASPSSGDSLGNTSPSRTPRPRGPRTPT